MNKTLSAGLTLMYLLAPVACGKVYNSSSYDASIYGSVTGTAEFLAAKDVINSHCATCHTHISHQAWAGMSEQEFIQKGLVQGGSLTGSMLYTKILGNKTSTAGNMPDGGTPLTSDELSKIETWILSITP